MSREVQEERKDDLPTSEIEKIKKQSADVKSLARRAFRSSIFDFSLFNKLKSLHELAISYESRTKIDQARMSFKNDQLLVTIESIDNEPEEVFMDPFIRIHICNESTGKCITHHAKENRTEAHDCPSATTSPASQQSPFRASRNGEAFKWNETLSIKLEYERILNPSIVVLFEVVDCGKVAPSKEEIDECSNSVMWAFLKPISRSGKMTVGYREDMNCSPEGEGESACKSESKEEKVVTKKCRLQLFKWQDESWFIRRQKDSLGISLSLVPKVFFQYLRRKQITVESSLIVSVGPELCLSPARSPSRFPVMRSEDEETKTEHQGEKEVGTEPKSIPIDYIRPFKRVANAECIIPDNLLFRFNDSGVAALSFSHSGDQLAVALKSNKLNVYNLRKGDNMYDSYYRNQGDILHIAWSMDDSFIACTSLDCTISVFFVANSMQEGNNIKCLNILHVEPPAQPTKLIFHPLSIKVPVIVTGLNNGSVSLWNFSGDFSRLEVLAGIQCHTKAVNAVVSDLSNGRIYTGDDEGHIVIWKPTKGNPLHGVDFEVLIQLDGLREIGGKPILNLSLNPGCLSSISIMQRKRSNQLLITVQDNQNNLFVYDLTTSYELSKFCIQADAETTECVFSVANFSPDGRYVIGGTKDGRVIVMSASGIRKKVSTVTVHFCEF